MKQHHTFSIVLPAFGAAIIATLAQIVIPIGAVPITLQTFAVGLVAAIFKPREAALAGLLYLLLGAIGLPAFPVMSCRENVWKNFLAFVLGDALVFVGGIISLHFLGNMHWSVAMAVGLVPFIIPDLLKGLVVALVMKPILKSLKNHSYFQ